MVFCKSSLLPGTQGDKLIKLKLTGSVENKLRLYIVVWRRRELIKNPANDNLSSSRSLTTDANSSVFMKKPIMFKIVPKSINTDCDFYDFG